MSLEKEPIEVETAPKPAAHFRIDSAGADDTLDGEDASVAAEAENVEIDDSGDTAGVTASLCKLSDDDIHADDPVANGAPAGDSGENDAPDGETEFVRPQALHMKRPEPEHKGASPDETLVLTADDLRYLNELEAAQRAAREPEDADEANAAEQAADKAADSDIVVEGPGTSEYGTRQITRDELLDEYESMDGLLHEDPPEPLSQHGKIGVAVAILSLIIVIVFEGYFLFSAKSCAPSQGGDESQTASFLDVQPLKRDPNVDRS